LSNYLSSTNTDSNTATVLPIELKTINDHDIAASHIRRALTQTWGIKSAENIVTSGQILKEARDRLPHGHFDDLTTEFDIEPTKAKRLIKIGGNAVLGANSHQLPPSLSALYHLTRLKPEKLMAGIADGTISKKTTLAEVMAMLPKSKSRKEPSRVNQMRRFYKGEHREAIINEFVNNPVLCETIPEEIEEMMKEVRDRRRRGNGRDEQPPQQPTTPLRPLPSRWS